jgi:hypothetical protein
VVTVKSEKRSLRRWFLCWEFYAVLALALFLRLFRIDTTEFDFDQADLFRYAHDAVAYGLWPLTSNTASINVLHDAIFEYLMLPVAAISANPLGGAILVALFSATASALSYLFARRYFGGRFAGAVVGLLTATVYVTLKYSRSIWQPNPLPFFMILFLFAIYRGGVERRQGWLLPAAATFAVIYQLHPSAALAMVALIALTLVMAPRTVRWRDIPLSIGAVILLFLPTIVWNVLSNFSEVKGLLGFSDQVPKIDAVALVDYQQLFISAKIFHPRWMTALDGLMLVLVLAGLVTAVLLLFFPRRVNVEIYEQVRETHNRILRWWRALCLSPERSALLLLLVWQILPFATLLRHSVPLHMQYFLQFLPGPFIFVALFLNQLLDLARRLRPTFWLLARIALVSLVVVLVAGEFSSATAYLLKMTGGNYNDRTVQAIPYTNDLNSLLNAFHETDELAQTHHLSHIYITMDNNTQSTMSYLAEQMQTPTTVVGNGNCIILPSTNAGPAAYLVGPYADLNNALLNQFANVTLVDQPKRLGGSPFRLYIVTPKSVSAPASTASKSDQLQLLDSKTQIVQSGGDTPTTGIATRWTIMQNAPVQARTFYHYDLRAVPAGAGKGISVSCQATSLRMGDQLIAAFPLHSGAPIPSSLTVTGKTSTTIPDVYQLGLLKVASANTRTIDMQTLNAVSIRAA